MSIAICLVVHNEAANIAPLISRILNENFSQPWKLYIYVDGSTDGTDKIVNRLQQSNPRRITSLVGQLNRGKIYGCNALLPFVKSHQVAVFIDGDVSFTVGTLPKLASFLQKNSTYVATSPVFIPTTRDLPFFSKTIATLYTKSRQHSLKYDRHRFLSGRLFAIKTERLINYPDTTYFDDTFLNLHLPYEQIAICKEAVVNYLRPTTLKDFFRYQTRLARAFASIQRNHPTLWEEQLKRLSMVEYFLFDTADYRFNEFFKLLNWIEKLTFILTRFLAGIAFLWGFYVVGQGNGTWVKLASTKKLVVQDSQTK